MSNTKSWLTKLFLFSFLTILCLPISQAAAADYIIGIGDKINISVMGEADLSKDITIRPDGKMSYPLIGELKASGLTPLQLRNLLTKKLSEFYNTPQVTINLIESNYLMVYIFGNLKAAGVKKLTGSTNLLQLFAMIGTLPENIELETSFLVRDNKRLPVNLYRLLQEGDLSQNVALKSGDTLFFKEKPKKLAKKEEKVAKFKNIIRIVGEVRQEKTIKFEEGMTILDAISNAGGFTPYARPSGTKVVRRRKDKVVEILIDMDAVRDGEVDKNIPLEPGDLISVPASLF